MKVKCYEELIVWQKAMLLAKLVYGIQKQLPKEEVYGLGDQMRRAVVSIPSNIAEGFGRESDKEFKHFLSVARGSLFEVKTQLQLSAVTAGTTKTF
jgi:four helix bundle protein